MENFWADSDLQSAISMWSETQAGPVQNLVIFSGHGSARDFQNFAGPDSGPRFLEFVPTPRNP